MAKKEKNEATPETAISTETQTQKPESQAGEASAAPTTGETSPVIAPWKEAATPEPPLERLEVLADRYRVPTWQQAALARMMGWAGGKQVSADEYAGALSALRNRRLGGGRME